MTPDPKLVEALASFACYGSHSRLAKPCDLCLEMAEEFFAAHRLVQLPEWPNGEAGELERDPDGQPAYQHFIGQAVPIPDPGTPVYILPGDPQEVEP